MNDIEIIIWTKRETVYKIRPQQYLMDNEMSLDTTKNDELALKEAVTPEAQKDLELAESEQDLPLQI
ncbi:MAG TPA: hypothetical protein VEL11_10420, partial [Candidatus Bathyarchaeia archaeon]|nr:hypothetical protein [Candidatus Bathyarchaeia archaeon]